MINEAIEVQDDLMRWLDKAQYGIWKDFYKADWLINIIATKYALDAIRKFIRMSDDGPDLFIWHKYHIMPLEERRIYLENTQRQVFSDSELHNLLKENGYKNLCL